jgi:hypothetical protein
MNDPTLSDANYTAGQLRVLWMSRLTREQLHELEEITASLPGVEAAQVSRYSATIEFADHVTDRLTLFQVFADETSHLWRTQS